MGQVVNIAKYKNNNEINAIAKHNLRCYIPTNVDGEKTASNTYFIGQPGQVGISRIVTKTLKDIPHRKDANKVINLVLGASVEEFDRMGKIKSEQWAKEMHEFLEKKFGKDNVLYSVLHNDETAKHLHFAFIPLRDGKLQSNYWFDGPAKLQAFRKEIYAINKKYGIAKDDPPPKEDKAERQEIDNFYKNLKSSEKVDDYIGAEIEKVQDLGNFTITPKSKIEKLTPVIKKIADYAMTANVRIKKYKSSNAKLKKANKEFEEKIKKQNDELSRFAEVENIKNLKYAELNKVNQYVNDIIKQRESKEKMPLPTPKNLVGQESKPVDKIPKVR
jgi:hypothetical protein